MASAGWKHTVALLDDGSIVARGANDQGQCDMPPPPAGRRYVLASAGDLHTVALLDDGSLVARGANRYGQCDMPPPPAGRRYVMASAGGRHTVGLLDDGSIVSCGRNEEGQREMPPPPAGRRYVMASAGASHTVGLLEDGSLVSRGRYKEWQCDMAPPPAGRVYVMASAGGAHTVALLDDGSIVACGPNEEVQRDMPPPPAGRRYVMASARGVHTVGLLDDGSLVSRGDGQCDMPPPPAGRRYVMASAGGMHTVALLDDGSLVSRGANRYGQCDMPPPPAGRRYVGAATNTFEASSYRAVSDRAQAPPEFQDEVLQSVRGFLLEGLASRPNVNPDSLRQLYRELQQETREREHEEVRRNPALGAAAVLDPEVTAEVVWTSAKTGKVDGADREFCWMVNCAIRLDDIVLIMLLSNFLMALNRYCAPTRGVPRPPVAWPSTWTLLRGGGFKMDCQCFFVPGKQFRVAGFWATTPSTAVCKDFMERAYYSGFTPVRWTIRIDPTDHCWHVNYLKMSLIRDPVTGQPTEDEFLFTAYSAFEVVSVNFRPGATVVPTSPVEIEVRAFPDNRQAPKLLPTAPWN